MKTKGRNCMPRRRFRSFEDAPPWKQYRLGEITSSYSGGTPSVGNEGYYNGDIPFIRSSEINSDATELSLTLKGLENSSAKMVEIGDILYALYGATSGEVGISRINGAINQAVLAIRPGNNFSSDFIMQWLRSKKQSIINNYLQGGQGNLSGAIIKNLVITAPSYEEQKLIGSFFGNLDSLISVHQLKIDKLKKLKTAYLSEMFPAEGEREPKRRFKGFTDAWEQHRLGEVCSTFEYGLNAAAKEYDGENKYLRITDIDDESRGFSQKELVSPDIDLSDKTNYLLSEGDIVFARTGASVGKTYIYKKEDGTVYFAGFLIRAKTKQAYDAEFIFQNTLTDKYNDFVRITSQRSGQPGVNAHEYGEYYFFVPKSKEEQSKIGHFLRGIDDLISLHQRKLEKLKRLKAAFLNELFV